jgi:hypothetical protein
MEAETGYFRFAGGTATLRMKHSFSQQHLIAGRYFAAMANAVEGKGAITEHDKAEHRAYVTGSVVFSAAFLEASINEFYLEAVDGNQTSLAGLTAQQIAILAELWETVEQHQLLGK